ncbi:MAG TPA: hypothetical protein VN915_15860 [Elusimicrobiota bacterium]|nr:hypothetical protein [Elusimicrobiota bacterium]
MSMLPGRGAAVLAAAGVPLLAAAALAWPFGGGGPAVEPSEIVTDAYRAQSAIADWPERSRSLAEAMMQEYGIPDEASPGKLTWRKRAPWTRLSVERDSEEPGRATGLLQAVAYDVPLKRWRALGWFDRGVDYDPVTHELIATTPGEATNRLALNLADEIIRGKRTAEEARAFFDETVSLAASGKSSPYMKRLLFKPQN